MFMFRSKRTSLGKRLWKARVRKEHEIGGETQEEPVHYSSRCCGVTDQDVSPVTGAEVLLRSLLKKLKENQLEMLVAAVESRGADLSACVLLPKDSDPHMLCCQIWRWPDLRQSCDLKRLPICKTSKDPVYVCCNPYHWSKLCKPESPPPPYCRFARERLRPEDRAPSEGMRQGSFHGSLPTNGEGEFRGREWCTLAYWEHANRVGRLFSVEASSVNVFTTLPHGDGMSLSALVDGLTGPPIDSVRKTRAKIGLGVTISQESDGVWAYNRSSCPIFVNSPTLDDPESKTLLVYRVPPGHCLNIFDRSKAQCLSRWTPSGPVDPNSVRISFVKGWGPKYSRQEITACPCWLEVLLQPCR